MLIILYKTSEQKRRKLKKTTDKTILCKDKT